MVQPFADGMFRYLSNSTRKKEMEMLEAGGMIDSVRKKKLISVVVIMLCMILLCACEQRESQTRKNRKKKVTISR